jgi:hypothetical protein
LGKLIVLETSAESVLDFPESVNDVTGGGAEISLEKYFDSVAHFGDNDY